MAPRSSHKDGLDFEDFRRLGVRPHEYRLTVIRRAAIRSTRALAEQQLTAPTPQAEAQLSRVAASTYRLLDPRKRQEISHRAYIGRILPQALNGAAQTNFHNELSDFGSTAGEIGKLPFERSSLSDAELIEMLDLDSPPKSKQTSHLDWADQLSDADLLKTTPLSRRVRGWNARARFPWLMLAAAGLLFGASLSFAIHRWLAVEPAYVLQREVETRLNSDDEDPNPRRRVELLPTVNADQIATSPANPPQSGRRLVPDEMKEFFSIAEADETASNTDLALSDAEHESERIGDLSTSGDREHPSSSEPSNEALSDQNLLMAESQGLGENESNSSLADLPFTSDAKNRDTTSSLALESEPTLPDPFGPDAEIVPTRKPGDREPALAVPVTDGEFESEELVVDEATKLTEPQSEMGNAATASVPASQALSELVERGSDGHRDAVPSRVAIPSTASRRMALRKLIELMPQLETTVEAQEAHARIEQLESLERQYQAGSPEQWVIRTLIVEAAWLFETVVQVEERLNSLVTVFDVSSEPLLAETFVGAARNAYLPNTYDHLIDEGLRLADQLLLASAPAECHQVVDSLISLVWKVPGRDDDLRQHLRDFSDAAELMTRHAVVLERVQGEFSQVTDADSKVLGQHYCLMLRRWDLGLDWLSNGFDRRLASVARHELRLGNSPTSDQLKDVGEQWLAAATRSDGRSADSIRLHAIDLLRRAQPGADALARLEIDRMIEEAVEDLPSHLVPLTGARPSATMKSRPIGLFPKSGVPLF